VWRRGVLVAEDVAGVEVVPHPLAVGGWGSFFLDPVKEHITGEAKRGSQIIEVKEP
jgi:hypothetical protein